MGRAIALAVTTMAIALCFSATVAQAQSSANPTFVCEYTAAGTETSIITSSGACSGLTLVDSIHQTLIIDVLAACDSTTLNTTNLQVAFNGDFNLDYDWTSFDETANVADIHQDQNRLALGKVPCQKSDNLDLGHAGGAIHAKIPMSKSTVFDKNVESHSTWYATGNSTGNTGEYFMIFGGNWHRPSVGAITVVRLDLAGGSHFLAGSHIAFFEE